MLPDAARKGDDTELYYEAVEEHHVEAEMLRRSFGQAGILDKLVGLVRS